MKERTYLLLSSSLLRVQIDLPILDQRNMVTKISSWSTKVDQLKVESVHCIPNSTKKSADNVPRIHVSNIIILARHPFYSCRLKQKSRLDQIMIIKLWTGAGNDYQSLSYSLIIEYNFDAKISYPIRRLDEVWRWILFI